MKYQGKVKMIDKASVMRPLPLVNGMDAQSSCGVSTIVSLNMLIYNRSIVPGLRL